MIGYDRHAQLKIKKFNTRMYQDYIYVWESMNRQMPYQPMRNNFKQKHYN